MMFDESRGMTPERKKYIDNHQKMMKSTGQDLPYKIGVFKPKLGAKSSIKDVEITCICGNIMLVSRVTHAIVCSKCHSLCVTNRNE